ncbi:MAG TPA: SIS domain-containing protein [Gemmatimonadaceae bacterium]
MTTAVTAAPHHSATLDGCIDQRVEDRARHTSEWFTREAERIAKLCHALARRFARGGRLLALGDTLAARSDARHVAVEFVHPVIVGKRALPALALTGTVGEAVGDVRVLAQPDDIGFAFGTDPQLADAIDVARRRGCLTISFSDLGAEWMFLPPGDDPLVQQELVETLYHIVWELVHVFFEHRGLLDDAPPAATSDGGAASFLYPFLASAERGLDDVIADVARSVVMKANEVTILRGATIGDQGTAARRALFAAAHVLRDAFDAGHKLLAFGNGGSATDAMDAAADYRSPPHGWPARPALDLSDDSSILTALANDIGPEVLFSRQIIAHGRTGDVAMAFSTSGGSRNIIHGLEEARRRGLATIAFVGYDGGRIAAEGLADCVIVSPSQHVPRVQEAQAAAHHVLRELVEGASTP